MLPPMASQPRVRLATCRALPEPDHDEPLLLAALARAGVHAEMCGWDDPTHAWSDAIPTVVRSTWNYIHALPEFLAWTTRVGGALWNPPDVIAANAHKRYLVDLARAGHQVVPTHLVERGAGVAAADAAREAVHAFANGAIVVKPAVSAGSFATRRFAADASARAEAVAFVIELAATRDVLVQPYLASVDGHGERALVWIDGALTHAVRKSPRFSTDHESVSAALAIADDERRLAEAVLAPVASRLLYARVDVARAPSGEPQLMELELIEPSLFLGQEPAALGRFAGAIARRVTA